MCRSVIAVLRVDICTWSMHMIDCFVLHACLQCLLGIVHRNCSVLSSNPSSVVRTEYYCICFSVLRVGWLLRTHIIMYCFAAINVSAVHRDFCGFEAYKFIEHSMIDLFRSSSLLCVGDILSCLCTCIFKPWFEIGYGLAAHSMRIHWYSGTLMDSLRSYLCSSVASGCFVL